jgi:hypothetical protein
MKPTPLKGTTKWNEQITRIEMKPIEDADIESNWAEHLPKRGANGHSKTVCACICLIVSHKAQHETPERALEQEIAIGPTKVWCAREGISSI